MKRSMVMLLTLIIAGLFFSCEKDETSVPPLSQRILFECFYINYAWGYSHSGFFIDKEGKIMEYSQRENFFDFNNPVWNFPDNEGNISEQALMENLQKATVRDSLIDGVILKKYADLIYLVTDDDITESNPMADAGSIIYTCYQYNENTRVYKQILLSENGDWVKINNNKYAKQISDWLKTIQ